MNLTVPRVAIVFLMFVVWRPPAFGASPKPKIDLNLPTFEGIPKADGLHKSEDDEVAPPAPSLRQANYRLVRIQHAHAFTKTAAGSAPVGGELKAIAVGGRPLLTEKFTTVVRVKSNAKLTTPIEISILDGFGDPVCSASGQLFYHGRKTDEAEYEVEWAPTPVRAPGEYQVLVRVAGELLGSSPLPAVEAKK